MNHLQQNMTKIFGMTKESESSAFYFITDTVGLVLSACGDSFMLKKYKSIKK